MVDHQLWPGVVRRVAVGLQGSAGDGEPLGELVVGTFAYLDSPRGSHQLSAEIWGNPGVTRRDFTAVYDRQGPIDLTPISEAEAKQAIAAAQAAGH